MATCEDWPACGHERGCCPAFDSAGRQTDMVCTCGARLPIGNRYSICDACMNAAGDGDDCAEYDDEDCVEPDCDEPDQFMHDGEADGDELRSAGWGTDEDYGYFGDADDY